MDSRAWIGPALACMLSRAGPGRAQLPPPVPREPPRNCTAPEHRQLDFWVGRWDVHTTGTEALVGRSLIERVYGDCAIRENWSPFDLNAGGSLSSYDAAADVWRQAWVDSRAERIDYTGTLQNGRMVLTAPRTAPAGQQRLTRVTQWPEGNGVRQVGETSTDGGRTWTPSYDHSYRPAGSPPR